MTFRLLILLKDHPSPSHLNELITFSYEGVSLIGIEYNLVLGIEKIQSFTPRLIVLDEAMVPMPTEDFVDIIRQYSKNFRMLLLSDDTSSENIPNVYSVIKRGDFNIRSLKDFIESATLHFNDSTPAAVSFKLHDPDYYTYIHNLLSTMGFSTKAVAHLKNEFGWLLSEKIMLALLYPMQSETSVESEMLDDIQMMLDSYYGGAVFLEDNNIGIIINSPSSPDESSQDERSVLKHIQRRLEDNYGNDYVFLISKRFRRSELENHSSYLVKMHDIGYFCKKIHTIHLNRDAAEYHNNSVLPEKNLLNLYHALFSDNTQSFLSDLRTFYLEFLKNSFSKELCLKFRCQLEMLNQICMYNYPHALTEDNIAIAKRLFNQPYQIIEDEMADAVSLFKTWNTYIITKPKMPNEHVLNSMIYMIMHCEYPLSLDTIASSISVSPSHLSHLFNKEVKMTFNEIRTSLRMICAKRLLRTGAYKIYEIAKMCGYSDYRYFCNNFKTATGMTPTEFRDLHNAVSKSPRLEVI